MHRTRSLFVVLAMFTSGCGRLGFSAGGSASDAQLGDAQLGDSADGSPDSTSDASADPEVIVGTDARGVLVTTPPGCIDSTPGVDVSATSDFTTTCPGGADVLKKWTVGTNYDFTIGAVSETDGAANDAMFRCMGADDGITNPNPAACFCRHLAYAGHADWYLPAYDELMFMRANQTGLGLALDWYWSSTEFDVDEARQVNMAGGDSWDLKTQSYPFARCVRRP